MRSSASCVLSARRDATGAGERLSSVTDAWGRVHEHPSILVADASLFPTSTKVNPFLTIMAFAERVAENVAKELA
jgi:choline dehydrogenase-like flavoprotein